MAKWKKRDGTEIDVTDMETSHIKNSLNMLKRKGFRDPSEIIDMIGNPPNGEMALMAWENELDEIFSTPTSKFIGIFEDELKKRGEL